MKGVVAAILALFASVTASARPVEPIDDLQWLVIEDTVGTLFAPAEARAQALPIMQQGRARIAAGELGEARRLFAQARVVLNGGTWDAGSEFVASLALRPERVAVDPAKPLMISLSQHFAAPMPDASPITVEVHLRRWSRRPDSDLSSAVRLQDFPLLRTDLIEQPHRALIDLSQVPDGSWELVADITQDGVSLGHSSTRIFIARGLERDLALIAQRLAALDLRDGLAASIAYPIDLAEGLDTGTRRVRDIDLRGLLDRSLALLGEAEKGRDPQWEAHGNSLRNYRSDLSGRIEPYRIFVPHGWDGTSALPLAVMLHGSMGDEGSVFASGELEELAQAHGIAVLGLLGDDPNSGWGNRLPVVLADGTMPAPRPVVWRGRVQPVDRLSPEPAVVDAMAALELVRAEYPIDPARIYLGGNSMGGEGVWHIASEYPEIWAAIAPGAGPIDPATFDYAKLGALPVLVVHGTGDDITSFDASREMAERLSAAGGSATLLAPDAGHDAYHLVMEDILSFFLDHAKPHPLEEGMAQQ